MASYTLQTVDDTQEAAVTFVRWKYNLALPAQSDENGEPILPTPGTFVTNAEYLAHVWSQMIASYVSQMKDADLAEYRTTDGKAAEDAAIAAKVAERMGR